MGKYMRRKRGGAAGDSSKAAPAAVLGVRTRSRSAATAVIAGVAKRRKTTARVVEEAVSGNDDGAGCYLHLRSRRLFKATAAVAPRGDPAAEEEASTLRLANSGASGEAAIVVGISRCSSAASSTVDVVARSERSDGETEACEGRDVESSVSDSECDGRERRETTPSSRPPVDSSDMESSQATNDQQRRKRCRRTPATATTSAAAALHLESRARMPAAEEIEQFFAAAEKAQAERFAAKYNFDVALGVPLNAGRFEWTPPSEKSDDHARSGRRRV